MRATHTEKSIIERFQMPAILEVVQQFREDSAALEADMHDLVMHHPCQWAGMFMGEVTVAPTLEKLLELVGEECNVAVRYLDPNPLPLVLAYV
jgi:hypothetical protein